MTNMQQRHLNLALVALQAGLEQKQPPSRAMIWAFEYIQDALKANETRPDAATPDR